MWYNISIFMGISYELAKLLKEAGFPQRIHYDINDYLPEPLKDGTYDKNDFVAIPTLSELIEACGDESVIVLTIGKALTTALHGITGIVTNGSTPEEAVSRLYLELNKK
jgi:hypothetical protein